MLDENEIVDGIDELGVLLYGHKKNAYWYGSQLSIEEARKLAPYQNATGLQVTSAVLAGMVWALENPNAGIVEADEMDYRRCLEVQMPYLGPVDGHLHRLDAARRPAGTVSRGHRQARSVAVQERAGAVTRLAPLALAASERSPSDSELVASPALTVHYCRHLFPSGNFARCPSRSTAPSRTAPRTPASPHPKARRHIGRRIAEFHDPEIIVVLAGPGLRHDRSACRD